MNILLKLSSSAAAEDFLKSASESAVDVSDMIDSGFETGSLTFANQQVQWLASNQADATPNFEEDKQATQSLSIKVTQNGDKVDADLLGKMVAMASRSASRGAGKGKLEAGDKGSVVWKHLAGNGNGNTSQPAPQSSPKKEAANQAKSDAGKDDKVPDEPKPGDASGKKNTK